MKKRVSTIVCILIMAVAFAFSPAMTGHGQAKIRLNYSSKAISLGSKLQLKVKGTGKKAIWKSSNKKIASVSKKGKVKGKKIGKCYIIARVGGKKLKCKITVESKAAHHARVLRAKILKKKGKKISYVIADDGDQKYTMTVSANKKNYMLKFKYSYYTVNASASYWMDMDYNLVTGKSGKYSYGWCDGGNDYYTKHCKGAITREFAQSGSGLTITEMQETEEVDGEMVEVENPTMDVNQMCSRMAEAFEYYDLLLKKKKMGTSMTKLGFTQWKK